jgi:hypothetical protein
MPKKERFSIQMGFRKKSNKNPSDGIDFSLNVLMDIHFNNQIYLCQP